MSITSYERQGTSTKKHSILPSRIFTWNESFDAKEYSAQQVASLPASRGLAIEILSRF